MSLGQNKKKQIEGLNNTLDSINIVLKKTREISSIEISRLNFELDSLHNTLEYQNDKSKNEKLVLEKKIKKLNESLKMIQNNLLEKSKNIEEKSRELENCISNGQEKIDSLNKYIKKISNIADSLSVVLLNSQLKNRTIILQPLYNRTFTHGEGEEADYITFKKPKDLNYNCEEILLWTGGYFADYGQYKFIEVDKSYLCFKRCDTDCNIIDDNDIILLQILSDHKIKIDNIIYSE